MAEGWRYGPSRNDASKEHPNLVPYDQLPEHEREYDRKTALETIRMLLSLGYQIEAPSSKPRAATHAFMRASEELERLSSLLSKGSRLQELLRTWNGRDLGHMDGFGDAVPSFGGRLREDWRTVTRL